MRNNACISVVSKMLRNSYGKCSRTENDFLFERFSKHIIKLPLEQKCSDLESTRQKTQKLFSYLISKT